MDPRKFKNDEEYLFAQKIAWAAGQNASDLLDWIDARVTEAIFLTEKEQDKVIDKVRASIS